MTIGFITDTYFVLKGMRRRRMGWFDVLTVLSLPFSIVWMLNEQLTTGEKLIDSAIAFISVVSGIVHLYVLRTKMPQDTKEE